MREVTPVPRPPGKRELVGAAVIAAILWLPLFLRNLDRVPYGAGDTAFLIQTVDNIASRGTPTTQLGSTFTHVVPTFMAEPAELCASPLPKPESAKWNERGEVDVFGSHAYLILFPLAWLSYVLPTAFLVTLMSTFGFGLMLFLAYWALRKRGVSPLAAVPFCAAVAAHPAWSVSVMGQPYVDRVFIGLGFLFLTLVSEFPRKRLALGAVTLVCALSHERFSIILGMAAIFVALFELAGEGRGGRAGRKPRLELAAWGLGLAVTGYLMIKFFLSNGYYGTYGSGALGFFSRYANDLAFRADFWSKFEVFALFNFGLLGLFGLASWRWLLLAVGTMLPNILGTIGGAEKTEWISHYHTTYFPFLVWAACLGYARLHGLASGLRLSWPRHALAGIALLAALVFPLVPKQSFAGFKLALQNADGMSWRATALYFRERAATPPEQRPWAKAREFEAALPPGSVISSIEALMAAAPKNDRTIYYFPIGIDVAQYVGMSVMPDPAGGYRVAHTIHFKGPEHSRAMDACLTERLKREGFDLAKPVFMMNNHAVFARAERRAP